MRATDKYIQDLRDKGYSCSQATLLGLAGAAPENMSSPEVLKAASGAFRGGIGKTFDEGTCGAISGAVIGLGFIFADDEPAACQGAKFVYDGFKKHFGTVCCGHITDEHGKKRCNECCLVAGRLVRDYVESFQSI